MRAGIEEDPGSGVPADTESQNVPKCWKGVGKKTQSKP